MPFPAIDICIKRISSLKDKKKDALWLRYIAPTPEPLRGGARERLIMDRHSFKFNPNVMRFFCAVFIEFWRHITWKLVLASFDGMILRLWHLNPNFADAVKRDQFLQDRPSDLAMKNRRGSLIIGSLFRPSGLKGVCLAWVIWRLPI